MPGQHGLQRAMNPTEEVQAVLDFWFGAASTADYGDARKEWFRKDPTFDAQVRERFAGLHARLSRGETAGWDQAPLPLLAQIVVLDQFSRNMFRDSPDAFASDTRALAGARKMVMQGWDMALLPMMRMFVYLPFEHSENLADQDRCVELMQRVTVDARFADLAQWAEKHRVVIARFGRFPHRNAILGRPSTPEEAEYLRQPGSGF
jgi:uncharacterized protein (DUF924 family)